MACNSKYCCTKIKDLSVRRNGADILMSVNLHIHCGDLTAIIGPNGAGKSTLLKALIGEIQYNGKLNFIDENGKSYAPKIGYVPQKITNSHLTTPFSVLEFIISGLSEFPVCFGSKSHIKRLAMESLKRTSSEHLASRRICDLSGGEMQRVMLSFALSTVPNILLLDEPISGVDEKGVAEFWDIINKVRLENDIAVIIVSHDFSQVKKYANSVVLLDKTVLKTSSPDAMFASTEFKAIFGV